MRLSLPAIAIAGVLALIVPAQSQTEAPRCDWRTARSISVVGIERSGQRHKGECVRTYGQLTARIIGASARGGEYVFVGAYFEDQALRDAFIDQPRTVHVLGVLGHCDDACRDADEQNQREIRAAAAEGREPEEILCMPIGHCHHYSDPFITVQAVR
jgi:hypothetical protein